MSRVIAFDWGAARIGVAVSDPTRTLATPHAVLAEKDKGQQIKKCVALVRDLEATLILVGAPVHLDGHQSTSSAVAEKFAAALERALAAAGLNVVVTRVDERWSSVEAEARLREGGHRKLGHRGMAIDAAAAAVTLQAWLDQAGQGR